MGGGSCPSGRVPDGGFDRSRHGGTERRLRTAGVRARASGHSSGPRGSVGAEAGHGAWMTRRGRLEPRRWPVDGGRWAVGGEGTATAPLPRHASGGADARKSTLGRSAGPGSVRSRAEGYPRALRPAAGLWPHRGSAGGPSGYVPVGSAPSCVRARSRVQPGACSRGRTAAVKTSGSAKIGSPLGRRTYGTKP